MTTLATDDFNRADGAVGANWTALDTAFAIVSNQAQAGTGGGTYSMKYSGAGAVANDQWAQVTIKATAETQSDQGAGPCVRMGAGANGDLYLAQGNTNETRLYRRTSGPSYAQLGADGAGVAANDVLYLEIQAQALIVKKNGSNIISVTDAGGLTTGTPGLWSAPVNVINNVDDFSMGDFAAGGGGGGFFTPWIVENGGNEIVIIDESAAPCHKRIPLHVLRHRLDVIKNRMFGTQRMSPVKWVKRNELYLPEHIR